jgi:SAM-dependent methyltransferase
MAGTRRPLIVRAARFGLNFARSADFRSVVLLRWRSPDNLFQPFTDTFPDRHPQLFRFVREQIGDANSRHILSFGCSTGEEVFTLRRYFPLSSLKGIDINPRSVRSAERRLKEMRDPNIVFEVAASTRNEPSNRYDAVFCMSVFRHGGLGESGIDNRCDHLIRFEDFEKTVGDIARCVAPGGLLLIDHSNFRFGDTRASKAFDVVFQAGGAADKATPIFDSHNRFLADTGYGEIGFRKRA